MMKHWYITLMLILVLSVTFSDLTNILAMIYLYSNNMLITFHVPIPDERQALHSIMKDLVALQMTRRQPVLSYDSGKAKTPVPVNRQVRANVSTDL